MIRSQKIKGTFICGPLLFKWMGVSQSWLDCFSIRVWAFIPNINLLSSVVFAYWRPFVTIFKCCNLFLVTIFFKCIKLRQILSQFSTKNLVQAPDVNIFARDYANFNNPIPSKDISPSYTRFIVENNDNIWCNKRKDYFGTKLLKKVF